MVAGRDHVMNDVLKAYAGRRVEPVSMDAEAPLFLMYTSGTTGRPKGCQHRTGGYLAYVAGTSKYIQDIHPTDVYWCFADIGWITGHSYIVYGPLALAATGVLYEGVPTYPDAGRPWRIAQQLDVNIFHTSPTTIRMLRKVGPDEPKKYAYHFKCMTTVGEPIEPEAWRWYYETVGKGEAAITDTWWQTENGGFLCSTKPALDPMKPGSAGPAVPGIYPVIYDEAGKEIPAGSNKAGNICIRNPWPGIMQTIWGDRDRYVRQYFEKYNRNKTSKDWRDWPYFAGDGAMQAADGYYRILGRVDDVINVAGHRLGTKEIESACLTVPEVAEAAVVPGGRRAQGPRPRSLRLAQAGHRAEPRDRGEGGARDRDLDQQDRAAEGGAHRRRHAEDPLGQDHAPDPRRDLEHDGHRRHHDAREPRHRRADPPVRTGRGAGRDQVGAGGHQAVRGRAVAAGSAAAARDSGAGRRGRPAPTVTSS